MLDNYLLGDESSQKVFDGIKKTTDNIRGCYGAAGGNKIIENHLPPYFTVSNDGKMIVDALRFNDPYEEMARNVIAEAGDRADKDSSDGRKTTMILTEEILKESRGVEGLPNMIRRSLNDCVPVLLDAIDKQKKEVQISEIKSVATIASESEEMGAMIQEIYEKIGREGFIEQDISNLPTTYYEIVEGVRFRGARSFGRYAFTEKGKAVYKNPKILVSKDKISSVDQLETIVGGLKAEGINELVIFCDDMDMSVGTRLAETHLMGGFKTLVIKAPTLWKDYVFEDFARVTGSISIDSREGRNFNNFMTLQLGTCDKIIVTDDETRVIGIKDVSEHVKALEAKNDTDSKLRLSWLNTKVAVLKVGANSESELSLVSKKAKDACAAAYLALKDGVVIGGGKALFNARESLLGIDTPGSKILQKALIGPMRQIMQNTGVQIESYVWKFDGKGFDAKSEKVVDLLDAGIIDPALVIKNAIKNSISIASTAMTSNGIIRLQKQYANTPQMPQMR